MSNKKMIACSLLAVGLVLLLIKVVFLLEDLEVSQRVTIIGVIILSAIATGLMIEIVDSCFVDDDEDMEDYDVE